MSDTALRPADRSSTHGRLWADDTATRVGGGQTLPVPDETKSIYMEKRWTNFVVEMVSGPPATVRAIGMGMDGDEVVFFNRWPTGGGPPRAGTRIDRTRVLSVTTDCTARTARQYS